MNNIPSLLEQILHARYGREVRQSIHDCIEAMYLYCLGFLDTVQGLITDAQHLVSDCADEKTAAVNAKNAAVAAKDDAVIAKGQAEGFASDAQGYKNDASGYATDASGYATAASGFAGDSEASAVRAETAVSNLGNLSGLMQIDSDGHLIVGDLTGFGGTFAINRSTGHLTVTWSQKRGNTL